MTDHFSQCFDSHRHQSGSASASNAGLAQKAEGTVIGSQPHSHQPDQAHQPTTRHDAEQLIELLTAQRDLYRQLQQLAERQAGLIEQSRTEELLGVLTQRQGLVDRLGSINERISPLRERIGDLAQALPDDRRRVLRELVEEVQQVLQTIIDQDEADRQHLEAAKDRTGAQVGQATRAGAAVHAYSQTAPTRPRFADHAG